MTEQQIEAAAHKLCEIRGLDPGERMALGATRLEYAKREIMAFYHVAQAIDFAVHGAGFP